jgi:hypothetical protein
MPLRISKKDSAAWAAKLGLTTPRRTRHERLCVECQRRPALKMPKDFPGCSLCFKSFCDRLRIEVFARQEAP